MLVLHFDVIALPAQSVGERQPSPEGRRLWNILFDQFSGSVVLIIEADSLLAEVQGWLMREGFKPSLIQIEDEPFNSGESSRANAVWKVSSGVGKVSWYFDVDPEACAQTLQKGIPSILVGIPSIIRPEWRNPKVIKGWDTLSQEISVQKARRAEQLWEES